MASGPSRPSTSAFNSRKNLPILDAYYPDLQGEARMGAAIEENVLVQIENLCTFGFVADGLERGTLKMNGWVFEIATGQVFDYDAASEQFVPLEA
jgi:carbonic anhydrase